MNKYDKDDKILTIGIWILLVLCAIALIDTLTNYAEGATNASAVASYYGPGL